MIGWGVIIFWLFINLVIAATVRKHAYRRGKNGFLWGVFVFLFSGFALAVYAIALSDNQTSNQRINQTGPQVDDLLENGEAVAAMAVRKHLSKVKSATASDFQREIYPIYPAKYDSEQTWWEDCIEPRLQTFSDTALLTDGKTWEHRPPQEPSRTENTIKKTKKPEDEWKEVPDSEFMSRTLGEYGRGILMEVKDTEKSGKFFVKDGKVTPESPMTESRNGKDWFAAATAHLKQIQAK